MKLPQLLLSMQFIRSVSPSPGTNTRPSCVRPFRTRNLSKLLRSRNLLLPRDMRIFLSQRLPILNIRGKRLLGATEHHYHSFNHLPPLLYAAKISLLSQQLAPGRRRSRCISRPDRSVGQPPQGNNRVPPNSHPPPWIVLQTSPNRTEPSGKVHRTIIFLRRRGTNPRLSRQVVHHRHRG